MITRTILAGFGTREPAQNELFFKGDDTQLSRDYSYKPTSRIPKKNLENCPHDDCIVDL